MAGGWNNAGLEGALVVVLSINSQGSSCLTEEDLGLVDLIDSQFDLLFCLPVCSCGELHDKRAAESEVVAVGGHKPRHTGTIKWVLGVAEKAYEFVMRVDGRDFEAIFDFKRQFLRLLVDNIHGIRS